MTVYRRRELAPAVQRALRAMPVVVLTGMRQAGKTTLLREDPAFRARTYVSLDDLGLREAARRDPAGFLARGGPLTVDEAHHAPELLHAVKQAVDDDRRPGRFLLSGSANFALLRGVAESLAGRALYLELPPFARRELRAGRRPAAFLPGFLEAPALPASAPNAHPITPDEIWTGGMPPVVLARRPDLDTWFRGFEQTWLERDLRDLAQVGDLGAFRRVLALAALRTARILSPSELARDAAVPVSTVLRWLSLLETGYVIRQLPAFRGNRATRLIKSPKLVLADSGLAAHLAGARAPGPAADEPMVGPLFETYAVQNLAAICAAHLPEARLHHWSIQGRHEVDTVLELGRTSVGIEWKFGARWSNDDLRGLEAFLGATPGAKAGILAHNGREAARLGDRLWALPASWVLA